MSGLYGVMGDPISHSLSPLIHRGWLRDLRLSGDYLALQVPEGEALDGLRTLERQGFSGLNVTLPHKQAVLAGCQSLSPLVEKLGAANTLVRTRSGSWHGENTDHDGFIEDFAAKAGRDIAGSRILLIGAGGAARAVALALRTAGADLVIANRTLERAQDLCVLCDLPASRAIGLAQIEDAASHADMLVNALSLGHLGQALALPDGEGRFLYDLSYGKAAEAILAPALNAGWRTADGLGMLIGQAALAFAIWHGVAPDRETAERRCRTALEVAQ